MNEVPRSSCSFSNQCKLHKTQIDKKRNAQGPMLIAFQGTKLQKRSLKLRINKEYMNMLVWFLHVNAQIEMPGPSRTNSRISQNPGPRLPRSSNIIKISLDALGGAWVWRPHEDVQITGLRYLNHTAIYPNSVRPTQQIHSGE